MIATDQHGAKALTVTVEFLKTHSEDMSIFGTVYPTRAQWMMIAGLQASLKNSDQLLPTMDPCSVVPRLHGHRENEVRSVEVQQTNLSTECL